MVTVVVVTILLMCLPALLSEPRKTGLEINTIIFSHHVIISFDDVSQCHGYSQDSADDPDDDDDHLGCRLAYMGPQWEHDCLISGI